MKFVRSAVFISIAIFFLIPYLGKAQEIVFVQLDKHLVVSGESIFFKAYVLNGVTKLPDSESRILYLQITDPVSRKSIVFRSDINKNGASYGEIPIPDTLNTGYYSLSAFTNSMRNFSSGHVYSTRILVVNQAQKIPAEFNSISISESIDSIIKTNDPTRIQLENIEPRLNKKVFAPREKVIIDLKNLADSLSITDVSISVTRKTPFGISGSAETNICSYLPYVSAKIKAENEQLKLHSGTYFCKYPAENNGFILSGHLLDKTTGKPINNVIILLSVADSVANLKYALTDSEGKFNFQLERNYNNRELILQLKDSPVPIENTTFTFENKAINPGFNTIQKSSLDSTGSDFLNTCQQVAMVNKIYSFKGNTDSLPKELSFQDYSIFGDPDEIIKPADFLEMPNLEDIVGNIVRNARYKVTENQSSILVADKLANQFWEGHNALVLLNNIPVSDYGIIKPLGSKQIERIELRTNRRYYGDLELFGIFSIFTKENYIPFLKLGNKVFSFPNQVLSPVNSFDTPDYTLETGKNSKIPDFRQTLYWNPEFELTSKVKNTVEFYTSDLKTSYDIVIQGISQNGFPVSAHTTIEVR